MKLARMQPWYIRGCVCTYVVVRVVVVSFKSASMCFGSWQVHAQSVVADDVIARQPEGWLPV